MAPAAKKARVEKEASRKRDGKTLKPSPSKKPLSVPAKKTPAVTGYKSKTPLPSQSSSKPQPAAPPPVRLPSTFKIVAGSYEKLLYGLEGTVSLSSDSDSPYTFNLAPVFIFPAHVSCIKAVAASPHGGKWLATGSADEIIKVWDLRRRKEIGGLMHHEGSITHLVFPSRSHLLSASEDGTLCLFRARDWSVLRALRGHKGRVNALAVHPSGKLALSVGRDRTLRMWDLMRGKGCASTKLGKEGEIVRWAIDGSMFAVQAASTIDIYNTEMRLTHTIAHPSRLHDVRFCVHPQPGGGALLLVAAEDGHLSVYDVAHAAEYHEEDGAEKEKGAPVLIARMTGHTNRVKAVQTLDVALPPVEGAAVASRTRTTVVCTVSSDGKIHVYDLAAVSIDVSKTDERKVHDITPIAVYDTKGTRLTCVTLADGGEDEGGEELGTGAKRKRDPEGVAEEDEDAGWAEEEEEGEGGEEEEGEEEEGEEDSD